MDSQTKADDPMTRCPKCFNFKKYCNCPDRSLYLAVDNEHVFCLCCDTPMADEYVPMVGYICEMCMDHFTAHPLEIKAIHNRLLMHVV
jgi:hypothetical protein